MHRVLMPFSRRYIAGFWRCDHAMLCKRARFILSSDGGGRREFKFNVLRVGCAFSAVVSATRMASGSSNHVKTVRDGAGDRRYYAFMLIVCNRRTSDVWTSCREMRDVGNSSTSAYRCAESTPIVINLNSTCRRVGLVHKCDSQCTRKGGWAIPSHQTSVKDGGLYYILSRRDGFPPFLG